MDTLIIQVSWEYFLGLIGSVIGLAYYTNGRFSVLETDVGWLKETISELAINAENVTAKLFKHSSPVSLTATGYHVLQRSGLKSYIDTKRPLLAASMKLRKARNSYEVQQCAFRLFADLPFEDIVREHLNNFAFSNGLSTDILRRVGAIYLRDIVSDAT